MTLTSIVVYQSLPQLFDFQRSLVTNQRQVVGYLDISKLTMAVTIHVKALEHSLDVDLSSDS